MAPVIETKARWKIDIQIHSCQKLRDIWFERMDPFVRMSFYYKDQQTGNLMPFPAQAAVTARVTAGTGLDDFCTDYHGNGGQNPEWNEEEGVRTFVMDDMDGVELYLALDVLEYEKSGKHGVIGTRYLALNKELEQGTGARLKRWLKVPAVPWSTKFPRTGRSADYETDTKAGTIRLTIRAEHLEIPLEGGGASPSAGGAMARQPSVMPTASALVHPQLFNYDLRLHVYQGKELPPADSGGGCNPYLKVGVGGSERQQTKAKTQTLYPRWHETLEYKGVQLPGLVHLKKGLGPQIVVQLFDRDAISSDDFLGRLSLSLRRASPQGTPPEWYDVLYLDSNDAVGQLLLSVQLIPVDEQPGAPQGAQFFRNGLEDAPIPQHWARPTMEDCTIELFVHGCRDLQPHHYLPPACPYVQASVGMSGNLPTKQTVISKTPQPANPNFDEILSIRTELPHDKLFAPTCTVEVFDQRFGGLYKPLLGSVEIDLGNHLPWVSDHAAENRRIQSDASFEALQRLVPVNGGERIGGGEQQNPLARAPSSPGLFDGMSGGGGGGGGGSWADGIQMGGMGAAPMRNAPAAADDLPAYLYGRGEVTKALEAVMAEAGCETFHRWELDRYSEFGGVPGGPSKQRSKQAGMLKGFLRITQHPPALLDGRVPAGPTPLMWPIRDQQFAELLRPQSVVVRLYVLEGNTLAKQDSRSPSDAFLVVSLGDRTESREENRIEDNNDPKFCEMFEFETVMPGDSKLKIDVVDYDGWTATKSGFGFVRMTLEICLRLRVSLT